MALLRDKKFGSCPRWTRSSSCLFPPRAVSSLFLSLVATPPGSPPGYPSLIGDCQCQWLVPPGTQQRAGKTKQRFAGAKIPLSYKVPPGKKWREKRKAKWNMASVQKHVGDGQPQPELSAPAPGSSPWHRTQLPALGRAGHSVAASPTGNCQSICQA